MNSKKQGSLEAPPIETDVGGMCEWRDGRINKVPCAVLSVLALLCHTHPEIGDLLNHLGELLGRARLGPDQLSRARLQRRRVTDKHHVATALPERLENESRDVIHSFVELKVGLFWLEVIESHLREVAWVNLKPILRDVVWVHKRRETPLAPGEPLKQSVLNPDLRSWLPESLEYGVSSLDAAERRRGKDMRDPDPLVPHSLPRQPCLEQPHLSDRSILEEVVRSAFPLWDLFRHVEVATVVVAVGVKGQLYPLFPKRNVHPLCVSQYEEPPWAWGKEFEKGFVMKHVGCSVVRHTVCKYKSKRADANSILMNGLERCEQPCFHTQTASDLYSAPCLLDGAILTDFWLGSSFGQWDLN